MDVDSPRTSKMGKLPPKTYKPKNVNRIQKSGTQTEKVVVEKTIKL
jgi:hypothetical protein